MVNSSNSLNQAPSLEKLPKNLIQELQAQLPLLEKLVGGAADIEFTWQQGNLYFLQARLAKLAPLALVKSTLDLMQKHHIKRKTAFSRITPEVIAALSRPHEPPGPHSKSPGYSEPEKLQCLPDQ